MDSTAFPTDFVNCTGLRFCLANGNAPLRWVQNTNAEVDAKNHVYEGALELNVPLLKDVPGFQDLSTNLADRWTKYSTFEAVDSWKVGLNWQVIDSVRLRSTYSSDIRAPNLNDLYQPPGVSSTGFQDRLTGGSNQGQRLISQGNPQLTPEEAKTLTVGIVLTPSAIPHFSVAVDFYETKMTNAITNFSYQSDAIQGLCLSSAPTYTSPFCQLAIRPITDPTDPNYTNPAFNMPTAILNAPVNAAVQKTKGYDFQLDYNVDMGGGQFSIRHLASYQPTNSTLGSPLAKFYTWAVQPHLMQTTFLNYENSGWNVALQNRWLSSVSLKTSDNTLNGNTQNYKDSNLPSYDVVDVTLSKAFDFGDSNVEAFLTASNLTDDTRSLVPVQFGTSGFVLSDAGLLRRHGPLLHGGSQSEVLIVEIQQGGWT